MPTYQYRCLNCKAVQLLAHSMQSFICPPCGECGGLTEKIIGQAPAIISGKPDPEQSRQNAHHAGETHQCGGACVLHLKK